MSDRKLKVLAISGSVRSDSVNTALLETLKNVSSDNFIVEIYEHLAELPIFNQDLEGENIPDFVAELGRSVS